jgi:hypothetical protein
MSDQDAALIPTLPDVPEASLVIPSPKRPWSAPSVILPTKLGTVAKTFSGISERHVGISSLSAS